MMSLPCSTLEKLWPDGGEKSVFGGVSGMIRRGDKIAVVGVNGAGKSTFLKVLAGETEATSGTVTIGANVNTGYFSQHAMDILDPKKTVFETVQEAIPLANFGVVETSVPPFCFRVTVLKNASTCCLAVKKAGSSWPPFLHGPSTS